MTQAHLREMLSQIRAMKSKLHDFEYLLESQVEYTESDITLALGIRDKIGAIKIYKCLNNCSLKEAKDAVEKIEQSQIQARQEMRSYVIEETYPK